jgi:predicted ester cyclase
MIRYVLVAIALMVSVDRAVSQDSPSPACPSTTQVENTALARAWHEDVVNRRNPAMLQQILAPGVVLHAAGGYPKMLNAPGITAMMGDFLTAFPDLVYTFDQFIAKDDFVVERYTATGTHQGQLGDIPPTGRVATWTGINIFRIDCGRIIEIWAQVDAVTRTHQLTGPGTAQGQR